MQRAIFTLAALLLASRSLAQDSLEEHLAAQLTSDDTHACSVNGFRCVGRAVYQPCLGSERVFTCEPGLVCSARDPSGRMCIQEPPPCSAMGAFRVSGSCDRYYLCVRSGMRFTQFIGYCEPGFEFSESLGQCVMPSEAGCSVPLPTSSTTVPSTMPVTPEETTTLRPPFSCPSSGLHADPASCRHYFVCTRLFGSSLKASRLQCPRALPHFDKKRRVCWYLDDTCQTCAPNHHRP